ncbi:ABC transporter substrate-binding protein [candidate division WOR-3 bacterium JGI_Cruoil_03_44_89]|uniref:ABC transporter substrate-binding protein n=1 Tax=candidate division WOR-3 bacterium JGI_Cruoil_03_44_89 TaxID=1973748 RepID=A0A235BQR3_UNCW3|nr:MAG: ABC transporter substrate-binding protein [candidate division WOR-3 bacterium JGI_Cruoil_03_44_89]
MPKFIKWYIVPLVVGILCHGSILFARDDVVRLTYWPSSNPQEIELAKVTVDEWNSKHPDIQVDMQPLPASQSSEEVLLAAVAARTTPDVCSNIWPGIVPEFTEAGVLVALDEFEEFSDVAASRIPEDILHIFRSNDGHIYQMPWKGNPIMMEYNVRLFREAGITTPPRTYAEFMNAAEKITKDTDGDGTIDRWMGIINVSPVWWHRFFDFYALYIAASGGKTLIADGKVDFNNEYAIGVFRFLQEGFAKGYFPKGTLQGNQFLLENIAIQFLGPWDIGFLEKHKPENFEYDFSPLPVPENTTEPIVTYGDPKNIVIFSTTKHPREAWEFVRFLVSEECDLRLLEICYQIPFRKDMDKDPTFKEYFEKNPKVLRFAKQIAYTRGTDNIPQLKEIFDVIAQAFEYCCVYGRKTPEDAIENAAEGCRRVIGR